MRRVRKDLGKMISGIICISMAGVFVLTACTVNIDRLNQGLSELGDSISDIAGGSDASAKETTKAQTEQITEPSETETSEEPDPTATPTPTVSPTPTPTPVMERVDFSNLSDEEIGNSFTVIKEDFSQTGLDERQNILVTYEGNTVRVECANKNIQEAVNLILGAFAKRADALYDSCYDKALANTTLTGLNEETYKVTQEMSYSDNGRLLSVIMHRYAEGADGIVEDITDYATFDMLTGQYVNIATIAQDYDKFETLLADKLLYAFEHPEGDQAEQADTQDATAADTASQDTAADRDQGNKDADADKDKEGDDNRNDKADKKSGDNTDNEVRIFFIAAQKPGAETATAEIYGTVNGTTCHTTVDLRSYASLINSYGRIVFLIDN